MRVPWTAVAHVLYQELRAVLGGTELHRAMVATLRLRSLEIGATITESLRRIVSSMSPSPPWRDPWTKAAQRGLALGREPFLRSVRRSANSPRNGSPPCLAGSWSGCGLESLR
ncbi:MAG TPA: hypothetical protein ENJ09_02870 [Planctomycetes bacterium]|nr:hypothetical protein [Planctomycetota bacterium]